MMFLSRRPWSDISWESSPRRERGSVMLRVRISEGSRLRGGAGGEDKTAGFAMDSMF